MAACVAAQAIHASMSVTMVFGVGLHKTTRGVRALIAQLAEHALSKRKVTSSNLVGGSLSVLV